MLRISVSDLDSYRYWKGAEDQDLEVLLGRLRGDEPPSPQMAAGQAFHKLMEEAKEGEILGRDVDGWKIRFSLDIDIELALPPIRELKTECPLETPSGRILLVGKVDAMDGLTVRDYKLTERFDAERYVDSLQWRAYLMMFGGNRFIYDVFQAGYADDLVTIYDYHALSFYPYPNMEKDVLREVHALAEIVARYLPEKTRSHEEMAA
jgi:hypothetical protein